MNRSVKQARDTWQPLKLAFTFLELSYPPKYVLMMKHKREIDYWNVNFTLCEEKCLKQKVMKDNHL